MDQLAIEAVQDGDDDAIRAILAEVCALTDMGFAAVARVTESRWIACQVLDRIEFGLTPGGELKVGLTICDEIRDHGRAVVFDDASQDVEWRGHPVPILYGFQSYASFPLFLADGSFYGTLCAIDPAPRTIATDAVVTTLRACADRVAAILDAKRVGAEPGLVSAAGPTG
jgi:GAF domain-containing protein